jgi:hypothetical protein
MKKQKHVPARDGGSGVHLRRAAARRGKDRIAAPARKRVRAVRAAAVHDDHLVPARAKRREGLQRGGNARRLVQARNDDGDLHFASFSDQS